jgi:oligopeptide/dipeptide ABC transporter ATP-binding protein
MSNDLLSAEHITKTFSSKMTLVDRLAGLISGARKKRSLLAVADVSLTLHRGEMLGLVGESGCGKSTLGRVIAGILPPTAGSVLLNGNPIMVGGRKVTTRIQTVFQDPFASLDARMRVGQIIAEGPIAYGRVKPAEAGKFVSTWLETVGLDPSYADRFPHQFSGGQRQRVAIARALAMAPDVLVCDEPVASLDVSIQAQIINLFSRLGRDLNLTTLFISHDLRVIRHLCERVAVMYLGHIVESGPTTEVYDKPLHPYSKALIDAVPKIEEGVADFKPIAGEIPSPLDPPLGCAFRTRCPYAIDRCRVEPILREISSGRWAACHRIGEFSLTSSLDRAEFGRLKYQSEVGHRQTQV